MLPRSLTRFMLWLTVHSSPSSDIAGEEVGKHSASRRNTSQLHLVTQSHRLRQLDQGNIVTAKETESFRESVVLTSNLKSFLRAKTQEDKGTKPRGQEQSLYLYFFFMFLLYKKFFSMENLITPICLAAYLRLGARAIRHHNLCLYPMCWNEVECEHQPTTSPWCRPDNEGCTVSDACLTPGPLRWDSISHGQQSSRAGWPWSRPLPPPGCACPQKPCRRTWCWEKSRRLRPVINQMEDSVLIWMIWWTQIND